MGRPDPVKENKTGKLSLSPAHLSLLILVVTLHKTNYKIAL
jgi:hypothetical protein